MQGQKQQIQECRDVLAEADLLWPPEQVQAAYDRMAQAMEGTLRDAAPILFCVMNGGLMVTAELAKRLNFPLELGYLHATRYRGATAGSDDLQWRADPSVAVAGRVAVVVDDIFDEGYTLAAIMEDLCRRGASRVYTAVLVDKRHERKVPGLQVDFVGLQVPDRYVFGCGMDYKDYLRNLPGIYALGGGG